MDEDASAHETSPALDAGRIPDARAPTEIKRPDASAPARPASAGGGLSDCEPGSYAGDFECKVDGLYPWSGTISFALVAAFQSGADIVYLEIRPGTQISGADTMGGMFGGDLEGMFDCPSGRLTGSLKNGAYMSGFTGTISLAGDLSGQYASATDAGVPGFSLEMGPLTNPDWSVFGGLSPSAACTWSAVRVAGAVASDAGGP